MVPFHWPRDSPKRHLQKGPQGCLGTPKREEKRAKWDACRPPINPFNVESWHEAYDVRLKKSSSFLPGLFFGSRIPINVEGTEGPKELGESEGIPRNS